METDVGHMTTRAKNMLPKDGQSRTVQGNLVQPNSDATLRRYQRRCTQSTCFAEQSPWIVTVSFYCTALRNERVDLTPPTSS